MDRSAVEAIAAKALGPLMERLAIGHWEITVSCDFHQDGTLGDCSRLWDYEKATIRLNPSALADEQAVLETLLHELMHVVLAPFDHYSTAAEAVIGERHVCRPLLDLAWNNSAEKAVLNLIRMYGNLMDMVSAKPAPKPKGK